MIIKTLVENTAASEEFGCEHGLSLYIETSKQKILFDVGAGVLFFENADKMEVDIADIDYLIISHGHDDHGGGLKTFLDQNNKAEVFIHNQAFDKHYALRQNGKVEYIGLEQELKPHRQIVLTSDRFFISLGIQLFTNTVKKVPQPESNKGLTVELEGSMVEDDFAHEQNLIIDEDGKILLVTGCAHNGIVNIVQQCCEFKGRMPDYVIGGFHLSSRSKGRRYEDTSALDKIGGYLLDTKSKYYTGHCTGIEPYNHLKTILGDNIEYLSAGSKVEI